MPTMLKLHLIYFSLSKRVGGGASLTFLLPQDCLC